MPTCRPGRPEASPPGVHSGEHEEYPLHLRRCLRGLEKIIERRLDQKSIGFGANVQGKKDKDISKILHEVQPHDLLKFGIIPELVGRLPVIASLNALKREDLVRILTEPKNALVKQSRS